ncbi:MAG: hypothetical protein AAGF12_05305 [Myxococcota bacterium]
MQDFDYDEAHCYATHRNCVIQIWRGEILPHHIPLMTRRWHQVIVQQGSLAIFALVTPAAIPPSNARRQEIKDLYNSLDQDLRGVATVLEDQGIKGTTASLVMTTMMLLAKPSYPTKNCTTVGDAAGWLAESVPELDATPLSSAVESARKAYQRVCQSEWGEDLVHLSGRRRTGTG